MRAVICLKRAQVYLIWAENGVNPGVREVQCERKTDGTLPCEGIVMPQ